MAKSIRITDELYALLEQNAAAQSRSLAQQAEHWARLGAAVEASGLGADEIAKLGGKSTTLAEQVLAMLLVKEHKHRGAPEIVARHAKDEAAVISGRKSAKSLFVFKGEMVRNAILSRTSEPPVGTGW